MTDVKIEAGALGAEDVFMGSIRAPPKRGVQDRLHLLLYLYGMYLREQVVGESLLHRNIPKRPSRRLDADPFHREFDDQIQMIMVLRKIPPFLAGRSGEIALPFSTSASA